MKIITNTKDTQWSKQYKCSSCKSELQVNIDDIFIEECKGNKGYWFDSSATTVDAYCYYCGVCRAFNIICRPKAIPELKGQMLPEKVMAAVRLRKT